jgi:acyl carrier protein
MSEAQVAVVPSSRRQHILSRLVDTASSVLHMEPSRIEVDVPFFELGADSIVLLAFLRTTQETYGVKLSIRQVFEEVNTLSELAAHLDRILPEEREEIEL